MRVRVVQEKRGTVGPLHTKDTVFRLCSDAVVDHTLAGGRVQWEHGPSDWRGNPSVLFSYDDAAGVRPSAVRSGNFCLIKVLSSAVIFGVVDKDSVIDL